MFDCFVTSHPSDMALLTGSPVSVSTPDMGKCYDDQLPLPVVAFSGAPVKDSASSLQQPHSTPRLSFPQTSETNCSSTSSPKIDPSPVLPTSDSSSNLADSSGVSTSQSVQSRMPTVFPDSYFSSHLIPGLYGDSLPSWPWQTSEEVAGQNPVGWHNSQPPVWPGLLQQPNSVSNPIPESKDHGSTGIIGRVESEQYYDLWGLSKSSRKRHTSKTPSGEKPYRCEICDRRFAAKCNLQSHMKMHNNDKPFHCDVCGQSFINNYRLARHMRTHSGEKPYACHFCQASFAEKCNLTAHIRTHTKEKPYQCELCFRSFAQGSTLYRHVLRHKTGKGQEVKTTSTSASANTDDEMTVHLPAENGGIRRLPTENEGRPLATENEDRHLALENEGKSLAAENDRHLATQNEDRPFATETEGRPLATENENKPLATEIESIPHFTAELESRPITPPNADTKATSGKLLMPSEPLVCEVCSKKCVSLSQLTRHMRIHTGERPFKCDVCDSTFALKNNLKDHMRKHIRERPFQCDLCPASFTNSDHLERHSRAHASPKPLTCNICGLVFRLRGTLRSHARTHTKEKPYECDVCQRRFAQRSSMNKHRRLHTTDQPSTCEYCQLICADAIHLREHLKLHPGLDQASPFELDSESVSQVVSESVSQTVSASVSESVSQVVSECVSESVSS